MSKIPEGATHTLSGAKVEYKKLRPGSQSMWLTYVDGDWIDTVNATPQMYAPINPAWSGEGLPPVGLECEWHSDSQTGWQVVKVLAYSGQDAWIKVKGKCPKTVGNPANFRPIRTNEQIESESRKDFLARVHKIYMEGAADHRGGIMALYDAGLRFVEVTK